MRKYFATLPPYRMRKVHVEFIGKEIYRPDSILEGVDCTMEMPHFAGASTPKYDAQTTTEGLEDDELVLKREKGSLDDRREELIGRAGGGQGDERYEKAMRRWSKQAGIGRGDGCCGETEVQAQNPEAASKLWEELGREEEPTLMPVSGGGLVFRCSFLLVFMIRSCGGGQRVL